MNFDFKCPGGIFSNLITMVLPAKRKREPEESEDEERLERNVRCTATQTEESPVSVKGN